MPHSLLVRDPGFRQGWLYSQHFPQAASPCWGGCIIDMPGTLWWKIENHASELWRDFTDTHLCHPLQKPPINCSYLECSMNLYFTKSCPGHAHTDSSTEAREQHLQMRLWGFQILYTFCLFLLVWGHTWWCLGWLLAMYSGIIPSGLGELYRILGIKFWLTECKANTAVLSLWHRSF